MPATVRITKNEFAEKGAMFGIVNAMTEVLVRVTGTAKQLCPIDKGQLSNSLSWKLDGKEEGFNEDTGKEQALNEHRLTVKDTGRTANNDSQFVGFSGTNSDHWFPEFGTRDQVAQPFLRPAKERVVDGTSLKEIGIKYGRQAMEEEFRKRKITRKDIR